MWVSPFRDLRINGYLLLPAAFRSLSRLSSALSAKASTLRSYLLDLSCFSTGEPLPVYSVIPGARFLFAFLGCLVMIIKVFRRHHSFHAPRPASGPPGIPVI